MVTDKIFQWRMEKPITLINKKFYNDNEWQIAKMESTNEQEIGIYDYQAGQQELTIDYPRPEINKGHQLLLEQAEKQHIIQIHDTQPIPDWPTRQKATISITMNYKFDWKPPNPLQLIQEINNILWKPINNLNNIKENLQKIKRRHNMTEKYPMELIYETIPRSHMNIRNLILNAISTAEDLMWKGEFNTPTKTLLDREELTKPTAHAIKEIADAIGHTYTIPKKLKTPLNDYQQKIKNRIVEETLLKYI